MLCTMNFVTPLKSKIFRPLTAILIAVISVSVNAQTVTESERKIPLAYDVDVVVIGGTTRGVAAAQAAKESGASVFLAAPRPYLGEDICGTYRLWLDKGLEPKSKLGKAMFPFPGNKERTAGLSYKYSADIASSASHKDSKVPSLLKDGKYGSAATESVQYNGDVSIVTDMGSVKDIDTAFLLTYQRPKDFAVASIKVFRAY